MLESFKLSIPNVPRSYEGRLYFILGPGLGDTVNDFRILHEVLTLYSKATTVVYADPRWKNLYQLLPDMKRCLIRYHIPAPSGELVGTKKEQSYSKTLRGVRQEIEKELAQFKGYVALGGFTCVDQHAHKELGIATKARAIGLKIPFERCRPFLPIGNPVEKAEEFLASNRLQSGNYIAIAPQTWADKAWNSECWEELICNIYEEVGLRALVLGMPGSQPLKGPDICEGIGLPLPVVANLIAQARCFIGLDSGLAHLAACSDVPIVGLQAQGKFPPYLIEPHSPFCRIHLTPGLYGTKPISSRSVFAIVKEALISPSSPICPLCSKVPYILGATSSKTAYLCRCGLMYCADSSQKSASPIAIDVEDESRLPLTISGLNIFLSRITTKTTMPSSQSIVKSLTFSFKHWRARDMNPETMLGDQTGQELWWSWDALYQVLSRHGWSILESRGQKLVDSSEPLFSFTVTALHLHQSEKNCLLQIPWGQRLIMMQNTLYKRWLCWESFEKSNEVGELGWRLTQEGYERDGRDILRFVIRYELRGRTIGRLLRSEWKALETRMRNTQDSIASI